MPNSSGTELLSKNPKKEVFIHADNLDALLILLRLAHGQHYQVPTTIKFRTLLEVSILCEKYKTFDLVVIHRSHWLYGRPSLKTLQSQGNWSFLNGYLEDRLLVSQVFRHAPTFDECLFVILINTRTASQWNFQGNVGLSFSLFPPQPLIGENHTTTDGSERELGNLRTGCIIANIS
jgi:hypothetical protein